MDGSIDPLLWPPHAASTTQKAMRFIPRWYQGLAFYERVPKKKRARSKSGPSKPRQRPTLPQGCPCSTIGPGELNFRLRDGNGCDLAGVATRKKKSTKREARLA